MTLGGVAVALGCVSTQPNLATTAVPTPDSGYVSVVSQSGPGTEFGLGLVDDHQDSYTISLHQGVGLVALPPGTYRVAYWATFAFTGERLTKQAIPAGDALGQPFDVEAGNVMLLGDWTTEQVGFVFRLRSVRISQAEAAAALRRNYPGFANAPVACVICAP